MSQIARRFVILAIWIGSGLFNSFISPCASAAEGHFAFVYLKNGRVQSGVVNEKTDDVELWLHNAEPSILILSSTPWSQIKMARVAGKSLTADAFLTEAPQLKSPLPVAAIREEARPVGQATSKSIQAQTLDTFASVSNWDRDAEADGLAVRLHPQTVDGEIVPVDGLLTVRLLGYRRGTCSFSAARPYKGRWTGSGEMTSGLTSCAQQRFVELGRWTERVKASQFTNQGFTARLPFRNVQREFDRDVEPDALVECRLHVNGQGILDAATFVPLRLYNPMRDYPHPDYLQLEQRPNDELGNWLLR